MILAIDYGTKRIGLAISDETETIAMPISPIISSKANYIFDELAKLKEKFKINKIVIGSPLGLDNKPTLMSNEIKQFGENLSAKIMIELIFWNETLTSHIAKKNLNKADRSGKLDSESARIILQEYLDFQKEKKILDVRH
jgi:putative holliday junction resolvase